MALCNMFKNVGALANPVLKALTRKSTNYSYTRKICSTAPALDKKG